MIVRSLDTAASIGCTIEVMISMTVEEVQALVSSQCAGNLTVKNDHRIGLEQAIVPPHRTLVVWRTVENGNLRDTELSVWVVGQENSSDGYKIIMRDDGEQFGLASVGFPNDKHLILDGWYGSLLSAFLAM
jgi:hypothetical protein